MRAEFSGGHPAAMPCGDLNSSAKACTGINASGSATQLCTKGDCNVVTASKGLLQAARMAEEKCHRSTPLCIYHHQIHAKA